MSENYEYDVFISHAVEDKIEIVNELVEKLKESGIRVWYSSEKLRVGRGLEETIKEGLNKSKHGIVVLTHNYFLKDWPKKEFHALWGNKSKRIFPVFHKITKEEIENYDPHLASYWSLDTKRGVDSVVRKLVSAINKDGEEDQIEIKTERNEKSTHHTVNFKHALGSIVFLVLASFLFWFFIIRDIPSDGQVKSSIEERIESFQKKILTTHELEMKENNGKPVNIDQVWAYYNRYQKISAQYRNEYYFDTDYQEFEFKKHVEPALDKEIDLMTPANSYGFKSSDIFAFDYKPSPHTMDIKYVFINTQPVEYKILTENKLDEYTYSVKVEYDNHIRYISVDLTYSKRSDWMKRRERSYKGFLPVERYIFKKKEGDWAFTKLE